MRHCSLLSVLLSSVAITQFLSQTPLSSAVNGREMRRKAPKAEINSFSKVKFKRCEQSGISPVDQCRLMDSGWHLMDEEYDWCFRL